MNKKFLLLQKIIFVGVGIFLLGLVAYRAATLSFTHDESATYLYFHQNTIYELFLEPLVWSSANNHLLNTLLYKLSISLFGQSDFSLRLPNVLDFLFLLLVAYKFSFKYLNNYWARTVLFLILFINPYTIDFFSLCRGYGLSMLFHFLVVYNLFVYIKTQKPLNLYWAFGFIWLASFSIFTCLLLFPIYAISLIIYYRKEKDKWLHIVLASSIFTGLSLLMFAKPIIWLSKAKEFDYGTGSIWDSFKGLISDTLNNNYYFGRSTNDIFTILLLGLLVFGLYKLFKNGKHYFFALSLCVMIIILHILYFSFDIYFPIGRKNTIFIALFAILISDVLNRQHLNSHFKKITFGVISFLIAIHFFLALNLNSVKEWGYDNTTKLFLEKITTQTSEQKLIQLNAHWQFYPTADYYIRTKGYKNITLSPYNRTQTLNSKDDYAIGYNVELLKKKKFESLYPQNEITLFKRK